MKQESVDVLVIGAGPAGTVAASIIRNKGFKVKIVEKEKFPRFVIGESLLPRCMEALEEAKLLDAIKARGYQQKFGAKFVRGNEICDFNFSDQFSTGWTWTYQVPRADFDTTLAEETARKGVDVAFETAVTDIKFDGSNSTTTVQDKDGTYQVNARFIVDASGYGRVIPRLFNLDKPSNLVPRKTLFTHIQDTRRNNYDEPNRIIVIHHKPELWIWVIPFSTGVTSVGFVGNKQYFEEVEGNTPEEKLRNLIAGEAHIAERFKDSTFEFEPRTIEGWSVTTEKFFGDGFVLTGNVTEFLDPVFSSGVTLAVESSRIAAKLVCRQLEGEAIDWQEEYMKIMMKGVDTFRTYVMAWYNGDLQDIFFSTGHNEKFKKQICSVLAGYVWDDDNLFVKKHAPAVKNLAAVIRSYSKPKVEAQ